MNTNSNINNNDDDALLVVSLEEELNNLRRHKRQQYQKEMQHSHLSLLNEWQFRLAALQQKQHAQAITKSSKLTAGSTTADKEASDGSNNRSWHVLGDVFLIWHRGPFATINGFRLGRCAITTAGRVEKYAATATTAERTNANASSAPGSSFVAMMAGNAATANSTTADATTTATTTSTTSEQPKKVIVPWNEINSALGQVVFLLYTLQYNTPNSRIKFTNHVLQPCGGTSKIGVLKNRHVQQTGSSSNYNNERRRITALAAYNANSSNYNSNNSMLDNNTTTTSTLSSNGNSTTNNNITSLPSPRLSLLYQLASSTSSTNDGSSITPNVAAAGVGGGVTWYNLYHYEENGSLLSMGYYARRNFNMALESLLYCIIEACACIVEYDVGFTTVLYDMSCNGLAVTGSSSNNNGPTVMSMSTRTTGKLSDGGGGSRTNNAPHRGSKSTNNNAASNSSSGSGGKGGGTVGGAMVNGIALFYDPANGEQWTLVCKYLLTNVKWLITYAAKHCC